MCSTHTLAVVENVRADMRPDFDFRRTRLAALFHDVGKPQTRGFQKGKGVTFHHHDAVGARMTRKRLTALRYSNDDIDAITELVALHLRFHTYEMGWTDSAVRRYVRDAGPLLAELNVLTRCDCTTRNERKAAMLAKRMDELEARIDELAAARGAGRDPPGARRHAGHGAARRRRPARSSARRWPSSWRSVWRKACIGDEEIRRRLDQWRLTTKGGDTIVRPDGWARGERSRHAPRTGHPSGAAGCSCPRAPLRSGTGSVVLSLIVGTTLVEIGLHGVDIEQWGAISSISSLLVAAWSGLLLLHRYRSDRRLEWLLLSIGVLGWATGQLLYSIQITLFDSTTWPSFPDVGYMVWPDRRDRRGAGAHQAVRTVDADRLLRRLDGAGRCLELHRLGDDHPLRCRGSRHGSRCPRRSPCWSTRSPTSPSPRCSVCCC